MQRERERELGFEPKTYSAKGKLITIKMRERERARILSYPLYWRVSRRWRRLWGPVQRLRRHRISLQNNTHTHTQLQTKPNRTKPKRERKRKENGHPPNREKKMRKPAATWVTRLLPTFVTPNRPAFSLVSMQIILHAPPHIPNLYNQNQHTTQIYLCLDIYFCMYNAIIVIMMKNHKENLIGTAPWKPQKPIFCGWLIHFSLTWKPWSLSASPAAHPAGFLCPRKHRPDPFLLNLFFKFLL